jgi:hypothetical protein
VLHGDAEPDRRAEVEHVDRVVGDAEGVDGLAGDLGQPVEGGGSRKRLGTAEAEVRSTCRAKQARLACRCGQAWWSDRAGAIVSFPHAFHVGWPGFGVGQEGPHPGRRFCMVCAEARDLPRVRHAAGTRTEPVLAVWTSVPSGVSCALSCEVGCPRMAVRHRPRPGLVARWGRPWASDLFLISSG